MMNLESHEDIKQRGSRMTSGRREDSQTQDATDYREIHLNNNNDLTGHQGQLTGAGGAWTEIEDRKLPDGSRVDVQIWGHRFNRVVAITHLNIFLYSCAFWIQQAVVPYLSKELGADPVMFGYLQTTFAVVQLAGGPLFGRFGDLFGSRLAMSLAFVASALSYFLLAMATNLPLLFLSRLPSAFMHAVQGGQMIVTDICSSEKRADAIGKLNLSYGIGMVVGPMIGGVLAKMFSLDKAALTSCLLSLASLLVTYVYVPAMTKKVVVKDHDHNIFSPKKMLQLLEAPGAMFLILLKLGSGVPIGVFQSMFSIIALETFRLSAEYNSYIMSYIGVMAMIVQGVGVGFVSRRFSELRILLGATCLLVVSYLLLSFVGSIWQMCLVFIPLITGLTCQNVITTSALTHCVSDSDTGAMLGLSMSVHALVRSLSPTLGGYMLREFGFQSFGYLGFVTSSVIVVVLCVRLARSSS